MLPSLRRIPLLIVVAFLGLASANVPRVAAQDATPTPPITVTELAPGVTAEVFAGTPSDRAPGQTVYLARFVFQPGAAIFPHSHPGTTVLGVRLRLLGLDTREGHGPRRARGGGGRYWPRRRPDQARR